MGNCARKHISPPPADENSCETSGNVVRTSSQPADLRDSYKSNSFKINHGDAPTDELAMLRGDETSLLRSTRERCSTGKDLSSGSKSNIATPKSSLINVYTGSHCTAGINESLFPGSYHVQRLALEQVTRDINLHNSGAQCIMDVDYLNNKHSVSPVNWCVPSNEPSDELILQNLNSPHRISNHVQSHMHLQQHSSLNIIPFMIGNRYSRSGCASATRSAMESPLTIDSGTHKSDKPHRSSVVVDPDRPTNFDQSKRTVSTTGTIFMENGNSDHRSSVGGLSTHYLVHQPYFPPNTGSSGRLSLGSGGISVNPKKISSLTPDNSCKNDYYHVAIFDYEAHTAEEVSARKGDLLRVLDLSDSEWWLVEHSGQVGYIPSSYLAQANSVEAEDWYFRSISRKDSERLLLLKGNIRGTFLVRASETTNGALSLSVRDTEQQRGETVKHYKIKQCHETGDVYITTKQVFSDLKSLVIHYSNQPDGLCCCLTRPCPRPPPVPTDLSRLTRDQWEISRSSLKLIELLGAGQFGEVWKGKWNETIEVAVKTLKQGTMTKEEFLKEARIMKQLHHPRLVRLYAVVTAEPIYIVTELMTNGSLLKYLRDGPGKELGLKPLIDMMAQIASGMAYLEKEHYIHRDLAARNILVGENNSVKVADFGLARIIDSANDTYTAKQGAKFPIKWTAPEAALMGRFTIKSDVWSFGIVIYEIITYGQVPFPSMNNTETLQQVENGYRMPCPINCPNSIYEIMLNTWDARPECRPTFAFLCNYFEDYFTSAELSYRPADNNNLVDDDDHIQVLDENSHHHRQNKLLMDKRKLNQSLLNQDTTMLYNHHHQTSNSQQNNHSPSHNFDNTSITTQQLSTSSHICTAQMC
ncbi:Tyrosine-protein kinase Fyn isoform 1 [Schistosoma japonicum]|uniref:Tyrosine-protein kinase n=2 Tax=Schistosoma japonicum TaxID=6182 RepID=A0A4Z2CUE7_SCHJA|nr:Tyrosine-protein kinase Fyn isoform 1 [Schistosoma japonicum]